MFFECFIIKKGKKFLNRRTKNLLAKCLYQVAPREVNYIQREGIIAYYVFLV